MRPPVNQQPTQKQPDSASAPEDERVPDAVQLLVASGGMLLIGLLYLALPNRVVLGPIWLPLALEAVLLTPLTVGLLRGRPLPYRVTRGLALTLLGVVTTALVISLALWVHTLPKVSSGAHLLQTGLLLWAINVLVFAVWYWEIDGGGPRQRLNAPYVCADLLFPQQQQGNPTHWVPGFIDYVFVSFCFSTALSPADTAPLTHKAKLLMMAQAAISLTLVALIIGRSINILN